MTNIRTIIFAILATMPMLISAQGNISDTDRQRWLGEMRNYKHDFLTKELSLTREQQRDFFPLYDEMEDEIARINAETREVETRASANQDATDIELENAARTVFELKRAEGQIEMTYFDKFKTILTPRQLLLLKNTERRFTQQLVKHHRRFRRADSPQK
ncbi:MAG: hypothetical protein Q4C34_04810 [Bacteroidales bacterium]|nr:hypothetical protein [Bacteroidales bacterium]